MSSNDLLKQAQDTLLEVYLGCSYSVGNADVMAKVRTLCDQIDDELDVPIGERVDWGSLPEPEPDFLSFRGRL
jgi:hypothetical protein